MRAGVFYRTVSTRHVTRLMWWTNHFQSCKSISVGTAAGDLLQPWSRFTVFVATLLTKYQRVVTVIALQRKNLSSFLFVHILIFLSIFFFIWIPVLFSLFLLFLAISRRRRILSREFPLLLLLSVSMVVGDLEAPGNGRKRKRRIERRLIVDEKVEVMQLRFSILWGRVFWDWKFKGTAVLIFL